MTTLEDATRGAMELLNREYGKLMGRSARYKYYARQDSKDRYFYTSEKVNHKGNPRYVAGIYRYIKTKKQWKMIKSVGFAKKYKADAWALAARDREQKAKATPPEVA